jgi:hypothetical protein
VSTIWMYLNAFTLSILNLSYGRRFG